MSTCDEPCDHLLEAAALSGHLVNAEMENARLRAALERIAAGECDCGNWQAPVEEHGSRCERRIADAALKDGGE